MIKAGEYPPLRQVSYWDGHVGYRCDVCGCGVSVYHTPGSADCRDARAERIRSQSADD